MQANLCAANTGTVTASGLSILAGLKVLHASRHFAVHMIKMVLNH
jgi:hypothetical protein